MPKIIDKNKTKNTNSAKQSKPAHSITFYIPSKEIDAFMGLLKQVSKKLYHGNGKRTISRYIRDLIYKDLKTRNLVDDSSPDEKPKKGGT